MAAVNDEMYYTNRSYYLQRRFENLQERIKFRSDRRFLDESYCHLIGSKEYKNLHYWSKVIVKEIDD